MTTPKSGDRVRVTYEAEWQTPTTDDAWRVYDPEGGWAWSVPNTATVEVIEPADDPSKDPVGRIRRSTDGTRTAVLSDAPVIDPWRVVVGAEPGTWRAHPHNEVTGWEIVGAVPGTPAAKAQKPRTFPSTGAEPPADVKLLRETDDSESSITYLVRTPKGWAWASQPDTFFHGDEGEAWYEAATSACTDMLVEVVSE